MKLSVSLAAGFACAVAGRHHSKFISQLARVDRSQRVGASESWDDLYDRKPLDAQINRIAYSKNPLAKRAVVPLTKGRYESGSGDCAPNVNTGDVPLPSGNTWEDFADFSTYNIFSKAANIPAGYSEVFENLNATIISPSYMGVHTLSSYDSQSCADLCDNTTGCKSINVFISRDPSVDPGVDCPNPEAIANYYCALYGEPVSGSDATNYGQHLHPTDANGQDFVVVLRASNAYTKDDNNPGSIPGFKGPFGVPAGMNVSTAEDGLLASVHFITPTDPHLCADLCTNINLAKAYGAYRDTPCSYFNTYELTDKGTNSTSGFYCAIFSSTFLNGTIYDGKQVGKDDAAWIVGNSYGYERIPTAEGHV
ncbi:hypothetical protein BCR34DRAFT_599966 [Clohesyomyces aquaticus]|uniref:Uncharacterized protein n=1 Tax=Clohesyomyces aquaticus TaxID=1231657 RepID=A0A1Y1ZT89_9PLEO|nr:hypothetical protein BCR34DRAFT_599966 [Clohesyomyces aquaticus]